MTRTQNRDIDDSFFESFAHLPAPELADSSRFTDQTGPRDNMESFEAAWEAAMATYAKRGLTPPV